MSYQINKAAVIGAGVMGSGIAAHIANAGIPVILFDIVPSATDKDRDTASSAFRNKIPLAALKMMAKSKPAPHFSSRALDLIEVANLEDDLDRLSEVGWVVEAVVERLDIKQSLLEKIERHVGPHTIVSSNTSGLRISDMLSGRSEAFRERFLVTHFFNPVRYMKLLELVAGPDTDSEAMDFMHRFSEVVLGKGVVYGKDTTNFVANRIGVYGMMKTFQEKARAGLSVEAVDKVFGPAMGRPKTAVFRTADLVGIDTFAHVATNCYDSLVDDDERSVFKLPDAIHKMVAKGWLGNKTRQGFYKKEKDETGKRVILSLDLDTLEYTPQEKVHFPSLGAARQEEEVGKRIKLILDGDDPAAEFAANVTFATLAYASRRIPEIADDIVNIDRGMRWGFNWELGPFELWDEYGVQAGLDRMAALGYEPAPWVAAMVAGGRDRFYAVEDGVPTFWNWESTSGKAFSNPVSGNPKADILTSIKRQTGPVEKNFGASIWDIGDGIALLEFHTKMNAIDPDITTMMDRALDLAERDFKGLVIGNNAQNFSVGANIMLILMACQQQAWDQIEEMLVGLQNVVQRMRYSRVPVVTAPAGMALGGGAEVTMCGNAVQAAAETYIGLVEVGVGLIPGASGNLELLRNVYGEFSMDRDFDPFPFIKKVFMTIGTAKVATSAEEAREMGFFKEGDGISMNRDLLLSDAKGKALGLADSGFRPPRPTQFLLSGPSGWATIDMMLYDMEINGHISAHDRLIGSKLATVLTGGSTSTHTPVSEDRLLELEREAFLSLCGEPKTMERIMHMLQKGKPLRN
jgi:3-hydroxyacyl-CoA dehydrogenase